MNQPQQSPNEIRLLLTFSAIAREENAAKLRMLIGKLESEYAQYVEIVQEFVNVEPPLVIEALSAKWPAIAPMLKMSSAQKVVSKIQDYLKEKEVSND